MMTSRNNDALFFTVPKNSKTNAECSRRTMGRNHNNSRRMSTDKTVKQANKHQDSPFFPRSRPANKNNWTPEDHKEHKREIDRKSTRKRRYLKKQAEMANNRNAHGSLPQPAPDGATSMAAQSPVVQRIQALGHASSYYEATIIADEVRAEADRQHEAELFAQNREAVMSLATMAADTLTEAMSTIASMSRGRSQAASPTVVRNLASELGSIIAEQDEIPVPPAFPSPLRTSPPARKRSAASPPTTSSSNVKRIKKTTGIPPRYPSSATPGKEGKGARKKVRSVFVLGVCGIEL
jgi:hypothetical protein